MFLSGCFGLTFSIIIVSNLQNYLFIVSYYNEKFNFLLYECVLVYKMAFPQLQNLQSVMSEFLHES